MNLAYDRFRLHAYVDDELTPDEVADFERLLSEDPDAMAEVAALRAQNNALHARYDGVLTLPSNDRVARLYQRRWSTRGGLPLALAATIVVAAGIGVVAGWLVRGHADAGSVIARDDGGAVIRPAADRDVEGRLQSFVATAALSHAVFVPEVRHPVEVAAADEAHLVTWLSKRLAAPLVVPHLGEAGWSLLGGRLLPAANGPVAQFMYQDPNGRRLTLAVSRGVAGKGAAQPASTPSTAPTTDVPSTAFRIAEEDGNTVFYWLDNDYAYALTGKLSKSEMTAVASRVYRQLDRDAAQPH